MYKNVLSSIPGIEYYPIIALVFFFGFFVALMVWYFRVDVSKLNLAAEHALLETVPNSSDELSVSTPAGGGQHE